MDVENPRKDSEESFLFFRNVIARNLKVLLQISCRCLLATTLSFRKSGILLEIKSVRVEKDASK